VQEAGVGEAGAVVAAQHGGDEVVHLAPQHRGHVLPVQAGVARRPLEHPPEGLVQHHRGLEVPGVARLGERGRHRDDLSGPGRLGHDGRVVLHLGAVTGCPQQLGEGRGTAHRFQQSRAAQFRGYAVDVGGGLTGVEGGD
jgi:hypothetical protein